MNNIGIITGGGKLPLIIGKSLIKNNFNVKFFCIKKFANINLYKKYDYNLIELTSLSDAIKYFPRLSQGPIIVPAIILMNSFDPPGLAIALSLQTSSPSTLKPVRRSDKPFRTVSTSGSSGNSPKLFPTRFRQSCLQLRHHQRLELRCS